MSNLNLYGNHRGGTSIVKSLPADIVRLYDDPGWTLADPKEDRAERLATVVWNRFPGVRPRPLRMTARDALAYSHDNDTLVLAMDTVADTRETLEARRAAQRATFQLVGRGPGGHAGTRIALQGTLLPGDDDTESRAFLLLDTLEGMAREASSRVLTRTDPLTASILRPMRELATRQTVRHLMERDRDPRDLTGGPLGVAFGTTVYPLVPVRGQPQDRYSHRKDLTLDVAETLPANQLVERGSLGRFLIVAVVVPEELTVHFMTVIQDRMGKHRVDGVTRFAPPPPAPEPSSSIESAVFTD